MWNVKIKANIILFKQKISITLEKLDKLNKKS